MPPIESPTRTHMTQVAPSIANPVSLSWMFMTVSFAYVVRGASIRGSLEQPLCQTRSARFSTAVRIDRPFATPDVEHRCRGNDTCPGRFPGRPGRAAKCEVLENLREPLHPSPLPGGPARDRRRIGAEEIAASPGVGSARSGGEGRDAEAVCPRPGLPGRGKGEGSARACGARKCPSVHEHLRGRRPGPGPGRERRR